MERRTREIEGKKGGKYEWGDIEREGREYDEMERETRIEIRIG